MNSFLHNVAQDIISKYGNNLSDIVVIFPNKRASLFLNEELIRLSGDKPVWSPQYMTISELFRQQSSLVVADQIKLVCELYRHYAAHTHTTETLDEFYGWGELMLSDFDDLDKNLGNSRLIFENTDQLHEFDNNDFLTQEQKDTLKRFFSNFQGDSKPGLKENFTKLWNHLGDIYNSFRDALREQGIAYEGMLYREVVESGDSLANLPYARKYLFIGFNLLQQVESRLFSLLKEQDKAAFYWDYDTYYLSHDNEAGRYIRRNMDAFPNQLSAENGLFTTMLPLHGISSSEGKDITYISASTEDVQARYISQWLTPERIEAGKRTAIVMCDEKLLPTVIHCIPDYVSDINITTGYPLAQTLVATLVKQIFAIKFFGISRRKGTLRLHQVNCLLRHPYMKFVSENAAPLMERLNANHIFYPTVTELSVDEHLATLFSPLGSYETAGSATAAQQQRNLELVISIMKTIKRIATNAEDDALMKESLYRMHQIFTRVMTLIESGELIVSDASLQGIINQIIRSSNVPFHGEPIVGLQIMGVLETRNLDFDHMLILSCNEGNMPKSVNDSSFIPHAIRRAYGLTTIENKMAIYAYYFHRMMQRAGDVTLTYNNASNDTKTNEMSRFMMQFIADSKLRISNATMTTPLRVFKAERIPLVKTDYVITRMNAMERISPSAVNTYLRCQMQFFFKYVCNIVDNQDKDDDEMDNRVFGLVFHKAAETLYKPFIGKQLTVSIIEGLLKDPSAIERAIDEGFKEELFMMKNEEASNRPMPALDGSQLVNRNIISQLMRMLLKYDMKHPPYIVALEKPVYDTISFTTDNGTRTLRIKGIIDRLDIVTGSDGKPQMRVVDYKTGSRLPGNVASVEEIFSTEAANGNAHTDYYLQTLLYSRILVKSESGRALFPSQKVAPALLYPHRSQGEDYNPILRINHEAITDIREFAEPYNDGLTAVLCEIFDYSRPFQPCQDEKKCQSCFYSAICGRIS